MKGRYFTKEDDFWRERMDIYNGDQIQRLTIRFLKVILVLICVAAATGLLMSCSLWKKGVREQRDTSDSVRVEYREKVIRVPVTVYVEVPAETKERFSPDSVSHLETSFAVSDAAMVWIDGVAFLRHSLGNKPQKIAKKDSVSVVERERTVWKTRRVTYTKTEIREKRVYWWQTALMWSGAGFWILLVIFVFYRLRR